MSSKKTYPTYDGENHNLPKLSEGNAGLHFYRLYALDKDKNNFYQNEKEQKREDPKITFLTHYVKEKFIGDQTLIKHYIDRQTALAKAAQGGVRVYTLAGHFVIGMGNAHPVENGFQWHYTLGVPYLAGSQVKGMVRSMIERYFAGQQAEKSALLLQWFGSNDKDPNAKYYQSQVGELIFFDTLPYDKPTLTVDVMTPHMDKWYSEGGNINSLQESDKIPADWHQPVPIPFLAVKDAQFVFSIGKRPGSNIDLAEVWEVLDNALNYLGAGGKTNTGFGYMTYDDKKTADLCEAQHKQQEERSKAAEFAAAKAGAGPFYAELLQIVQAEGWQETGDTAKNKFTESLRSKWLEKLEANPDEQDSIALFIEIAKQHYPTQMKNPQLKKVKPQQREWILRLLALKTD